MPSFDVVSISKPLRHNSTSSETAPLHVKSTTDFPPRMNPTPSSTTPRSSVVADAGPAIRAYIQGEGGQHVGHTGIVQPGLNTGVMLGDIAGLPDQLRKFRCKIDSVLAGTAADFQ